MRHAIKHRLMEAVLFECDLPDDTPELKRDVIALKNAKSNGIDLTGANLNDVDLTTANLTGAKVTEAYFGEAELAGSESPTNAR